MSLVRDPAIKLFGKTISVQPNWGASSFITKIIPPPLIASVYEDHNLFSSTHGDQISISDDDQEDNKNSSQIKLPETKHDDYVSHNDLNDPETSSGNPKTPSVDDEPTSPNVSKNDEQSETTSISQENTIKKPDKILPCPRCSSTETKFCYFNNYNVNQPRYFCKNCQRYWTAGGSMRSVPVGSGRRKNKSSPASYYRHVMVSESLQNANATILAFGSDLPHCFQKQRVSDSENGGHRSSNRSSVTVSNVSTESVMKSFQTSAPQLPCLVGPGFGPLTFPVIFYPATAYWGCTLPGPYWDCASLESVVCPSPNSQCLGKHSREGEMIEPSISKDTESGVCIPKTLRIDDPSEAAKSSIWSTLGIKNGKYDSTNGKSMFKDFQSKVDEKNLRAERSLAFQANPAALSRSLNFHECA